MSPLKCQLSAALKRKCLSLDDKISLLDYASEHPKTGCRQLAKHFNMGKTAVATFLKDAKNLQKDYELFKGSFKKRRHGKYHVINEILYNWHGKCTNANVYPDGPLLQEEAIEIKKRLGKEELNDFSASNGWLESWKSTYGLIEKRLCSEVDKIPAKYPRNTRSVAKYPK